MFKYAHKIFESRELGSAKISLVQFRVRELHKFKNP